MDLVEKIEKEEGKINDRTEGEIFPRWSLLGSPKDP